jgi:HlyD family secretion protein
MNHVMDRPIWRPWWQRKIWWQSGLLLGALLLLFASVRMLFGGAERSLRMAAANVTIATVQRGVFHDFIPMRGTVTALNTVYVDAPEGGRVERLLVQAGDTVKAGEPMVRLSNTDLMLDVLDREGRLIESITELQSYQTQLEQNRVNNEKALAQIDYSIVSTRRALVRRQPLLAQSSITVETIDQLQDQLDLDVRMRPMQAVSNRIQEQLRLSQLPQIRHQLQTLQRDVALTHSTLDDLTVRAPVAGQLTAMDLKVGQTLGRNGRFAEVTPNTGYKLSAAVDEYYLQRVRVGQHAQMQIGDRDWGLSVSRIYPQVKDGTFTVDLTFDGAGPAALVPGEALEGRLSLGSDRLATIIPAGPFLERTGGDWIFAVAADGRSARRRTISVGRRNAEQVEILDGLAPGEQVMTSDYTGLDRIDRIDFTR